MTGPKYVAFISYSHIDTAMAKSIHRGLEHYVLPRRLVGTTTHRGAIPARLTPIFRDRDELSADEDLSLQVRTALAQSGALIVVCSPHARTSKWVAREIETFRALHPDRPVLAALIDGEPADAFPDLLTVRGGAPTEPAAADFRKGRDGNRLGRLKLVAGLTGVPLDALVQRDHQRYQRRVMVVTLVAAIALLVMGLLLMLAIRARDEAERQRAQAEGLIDYMLTDLRTRLRGVGRLDVMAAVNERAMLYYTEQEALDVLPTDSLERRARVMLAMGEDDDLRGETVSAMNKFKEAYRTTAALLAREPAAPERMFTHAQSAYWVGYIDYNAGRLKDAARHWQDYRALAYRMERAAPGNPKYISEIGYAESNLCALALTVKPKNMTLGAKACVAAEAAKARLTQIQPTDAAVIADHGNAIAWLADYHLAAGQLDHAAALRQRHEKMVNDQIARDPANKDLGDTWVTVQLALAEIALQRGQKDEVRRRLDAAQARLDQLLRFDPVNRQWKSRASMIANKRALL